MEKVTFVSNIRDAAHAELPATMRRRVGWNSHAVVCRLDADADEAAIGVAFCALLMQLSSGVGEVRVPGGTAAGSPALYADTLPYPSTSSMALRQRARETRRPLSADADQILRASILRYSDGHRDLIVVGDRTVLAQTAMLRVARFCLASGNMRTSIQLRPATVLSTEGVGALLGSEFSPSMEWGSDGGQPGEGVLEMPIEADVAPEYWLTALGWVLSCFYGKPSPAIAVLQKQTSQGEEIELGVDGFRLASLSSDGDAAVASVLDHSRLQLQGAARYTEALITALKDQCERPVDVSIGAVFPLPTSCMPEGLHDAEYIPCNHAIFPITLVFGAGGGDRLICHFDTSVYSESAVLWLQRCLVHVCSQLRSMTTERLADVELLSPVACKEVVALGRPAKRQATATDRIEDVFARVCNQQPDAIALSFEDEDLTYAQLDNLSNRLAMALSDHGVVTGSFVGICLNRSIAVVVAMLAILKCGAVYVPMDPDYPNDRLEYTARDAGLKLTLTEGGSFPEIPGMVVATITDLCRDVGDADLAPAKVGGATDAAYMIYTSGSTGRPKGVLVPHRNVVSLIEATREEFALSSRDTWTLFHSSAFDFSVWEIWGCLLTGGQLVVVPHAISRDPEQFRDLIARKSVSVLNQTPSAFYQLIEADLRERVSDSLRLIIFGGESLDARALLPWFDRHPESRCRLVNMFGITETTVHVTWQDVRRHEALGASRSVGTAIPGWHLYVMDAQQRLLPPGVAGEIYVGGAGVALRYHGQEELTRSRFLLDPFVEGIMYRSGDRGRLLADGKLEHLGRLDNQIKLRGFRIELDEIRRVLLGHDAVRAAAVLFNQPKPNDPASARIDAYLVAEGASAADIRAHSGKFLPEHMVPSTFTFLATMPLTTNGKLDVKRLPPPELPAPAPTPATSGSAGPASGMEETIRSIWQGVLGREISVDDNFFDLGGNSLLAVRIASAMRGQGLPPLPMRELYTHQTIRNLVAAMV